MGNDQVWKFRKLKVEFSRHYLCVGAYWAVTEYETVQGWPVPSDLRVWLCPIPLLAIILHYEENI